MNDETCGLDYFFRDESAGKMDWTAAASIARSEKRRDEPRLDRWCHLPVPMQNCAFDGFWTNRRLDTIMAQKLMEVLHLHSAMLLQAG